MILIVHEVGWAPEPIWIYGRAKNLLPLSGIELFDTSVHLDIA
jgi:hypothetical protein